MVNLMEYVKSDRSMLSPEGRQRRMDILNKVVKGEIWLEAGWLDVKGGRVRHHGWASVRLERLIKELKETNERVKGRIIYSGSLHFLINGKFKDKIIKCNLWGAKKNRENYFCEEEDKDKVVRFRLQLIDLITPLTLKELIEKLNKLQNLKT